MIKKACLCLSALALAAGISMQALAAPAAVQETPTETQEECLSQEVQAVNAAELTPLDCQSAALDALVAQKVDELVTDEMSTYQKLEACYDYLTGNVRYGNHMAYLSTVVGNTNCADIFYTYGEVEGFGAVALTAGVGQCNAYAAAFILMAREIGLDGKLVTGSTLNGGGGYAYHKWAELFVGDETYVFDPQLDQSLAASGLPAQSLFCKTYEQVGRRYRRNV